jgi:hypothetical protein
MEVPRVFKGMKRMIPVLALALMPLPLAAQQDPAARLAEVLPPDLVAQVVARMESAQSRELPSRAVANLALEGVAKGRSAEEVLTALDALVSDMGRAREAIEAAGRDPGAGEIEAATTALRMGVDGSAVSDLARSGPAGRNLAVPLLVMGGLAERGLPSDEALEAVRERLAARAADAELLNTFGLPALGRGRGLAPDGVGPDVGGGRAGLPVPPGPADAGGRANGGRGRGGGPPN